MKHEFIINNDSSSLVILFAGWGTSPTAFSKVNVSADFLLIYDYNNFEFDISVLEKYSNIYIFAWSFGVYAASRLMVENPQLPICFKMAINGTTTPVDNNYGIPETIFMGTLNSLSERSLLKFYRRICTSSQQYEEFLSLNPNRDIDSLRSELESVYNHSTQCNNCAIEWDKVIVSTNDNIFPVINQRNSWSKLCNNIIEIEGAHLPTDFNQIFADNIINKPLLKRRFSKQLSDYNNFAICQQQISEKLYRLWKESDFKTDSTVLEIGCGTGFLTKLYSATLHPRTLVLNDLCKIPSCYFDGIEDYTFAQGDAEQIDFGTHGTFDYIVSSSAIQWFENITHFLNSIHAVLNERGILALSTFGVKNMKEISTITGVSLNYIDINKIKEILSINYDILTIVEDENVIYFDTPLDVLRHIKSTGVNSISPSQRWTKSQLNDFTRDYMVVENKFPLTYNPIYIIARKKNTINE